MRYNIVIFSTNKFLIRINSILAWINLNSTIFIVFISRIIFFHKIFSNFPINVIESICFMRKIQLLTPLVIELKNRVGLTVFYIFIHSK